LPVLLLRCASCSVSRVSGSDLTVGDKDEEDDCGEGGVVCLSLLGAHGQCDTELQRAACGRAASRTLQSRSILSLVNRPRLDTWKERSRVVKDTLLAQLCDGKWLSRSLRLRLLFIATTLLLLGLTEL